MKKNQLLRLKALLAKPEADLSADEKSELQTLTKAAKSAKIDTKAIDAAIANCDDDDEDEEGAEEMTEEEVKDVVTKAVKDAMAGQKNLTADEVAEVVTAELSKKAVSEDKIRSIVGESLKEHVKSAPKMEHPADSYGADFPCESRAGNLSVAQKQLLNICLMKVSDDALMDLGTKRPRDINEGIPDSIVRRSKAVSDRVAGNLKVAGAKGLTTTGSGSGAELVYTDLATDLQQRLYLESDLAKVLMGRELNMPTDPFKLPIKTVRTAFAAGSESPTPLSLQAYLHYNNPTLANITLDAKKIIGIASYSYEANEDSVIAILPLLQNDMGEGAAAAFEDAVLNGDVGANTAHQEYLDNLGGSAYPSTDSVKLLFDGMRKAGLAVGVLDWSTGGVSKSNFMNARATMGKYGVNPRDLAIIVSSYGYIQLQAIEEAFRADARGGNNLATVGTGVLPQFNGINVVVTEQLPAGCTAAGIFDNSGTYETLLITNLTQWMVGVRRGFTVEVTSDPLVQTNYVVASFRRAFVPKEVASASLPHTVLATKWG